MIQKLKTILLSASLLFVFTTPVFLPAVVSAQVDQTQINNQLCSGTNIDVTGGSTNCDPSTNGESVNQKIAKVINILSVIVGIVAVIMIIVGGFRYITSGGASEKVTGAKNTILYAIIGLIIVALSQVIVHFVINKVGT